MNDEKSVIYVQPECQVVVQQAAGILCQSSGVTPSNPFGDNEEIDFGN